LAGVKGVQASGGDPAARQTAQHGFAHIADA
jgi:hypothetical protein